jgi:hypothetical protein
LIGLRKIHLVVGFTLVPFILITAGTAVLILVTQQFYGLLKWHMWFRWGGVVLGAGLVFLAISGAILYLNMRIQQWKRRAAKVKK